MIIGYPLEWIDSLILHTLNPKKTNISDLSQNELDFITDTLSKESQKIQVQLKNEIFSLQKKRQIRLLVRKYHSTSVYLLDNMIEHQKDEVFQTGTLTSIIESIIRTLDDLLFFIENRYPNYLSLDERVPMPYLIVSRNEMLLKLEKLKKKKIANIRDSQVMEIVIAALSNSNQNKTGFKITYREILYQKELVKRLDSLLFIEDTLGFYSSLDELLIELNFNDYHYSNHFIDQIVGHLNQQESLIDKIDELALYYKEFSQLLSGERITFDPTKQNISYVLDNWFMHELGYLEKKMGLFADSEGIYNLNRNTEIGDNKVQCMLSTDQIALILRAGDESRIIKAKSMNQVFKTIVPHLSTVHKKVLSYNSMRSKSYTVEGRDKEIAIKTLERIIKHIKEF
jgi:hypothetical protein